MRVEQFLAESARRFPEKTALVVESRRYTYAELDAEANRLAHALRRLGVRRGDRVALFLENSAEAVVALYGVLKAGGAFIPVNPSTKPGKLAYVLRNSGAVVLITQPGLDHLAGAALEEAPGVRAILVREGAAPGLPRAVFWHAALEGTPVDPPEEPGLNVDVAMIIYTSGSTGSPKGVTMTHQNVVFAAGSITQYLENTADDVILNVLPLSFDYGLYQVLMAFRMGATLVLEKSFAYPYAVLKRLREERVTGFPLVPTVAAILLQLDGFNGERFPDLRYFTNTAAALPPAHIERLQRLFPGVRLYSMYGLTECKRCTYLPPEQLALRPNSVGRAIPGTEVYLVNDAGRRLGPGEVGELVVRGAHVMQGYWNDPEATHKVLRPGPYPWERVLHTGDLFRMDEEGYLYFVGRKDDIIKSRGEKVSPKEVEMVLYALEGVREAAVVGTPDPILGHAIKAVVVPVYRGALKEQDVLRHCARYLEDYMVPRCVEFRDELPKTSTGKIRRSEVQAQEVEAAHRQPGGEEGR